MSRLEFASVVATIIAGLILGYTLGYLDGRETGKRQCAVVAEHEVVATTPTSCMYAERAGRLIYRRTM